MSEAAIKKLFKSKKRVTLVGFNGTRWVDVISGPFPSILTQYYMCSPWKYFHIRLDDGGIYPTDYRKLK